ncbi:MAG: hypothetical protein K2X39_04700 [Silvanigrellaceae bacterium]|nr:hypothetical protein [Silvanigrellaceae bacterium]
MSYAKDHDVIDAEVISIENSSPSQGSNEDPKAKYNPFKEYTETLHQRVLNHRRALFFTQLGWKQVLIFLPLFLVLVFVSIMIFICFLFYFMAKVLIKKIFK